MHFPRWLVTLSVAVLTGCSEADCVNQILASYPSAGNELNAVVYQRSCGTASGPNIQISILPSGASLPNRGGNIFAGEVPGDPAAPAAERLPPVKVEWIGRNRLHLTYDRRVRVSRQKESEAAVVIQYTEES